MSDPAQVGRAVLAAFTKGREIAIERARARAAPAERAVRELLDTDILAGHPPRGRAERISRRLHGTVSRRTVQRILARLYSVANSP